MMTTDEIHELRNAARAVQANEQLARARMSARAAARCLSGVVRLVALRYGHDLQREACAALANSQATWESIEAGKAPASCTGTCALPHDPKAHLDAILTVALVAKGVLPLCGWDNMRAALAFWATETDPAEWRRVVDRERAA